jgi:hypothetical protein
MHPGVVCYVWAKLRGWTENVDNNNNELITMAIERGFYNWITYTSEEAA